MTLILPAEFSPPVVTAVATGISPPLPPEDPGGQGEDFGKSTPVGAVVILLFFVATYFLVRSMNKHLKRVPESFDDKPRE